MAGDPELLANAVNEELDLAAVKARLAAEPCSELLAAEVVNLEVVLVDIGCPGWFGSVELAKAEPNLN